MFPGISDLAQGDVNRDGEVTVEDLVTLNSFVIQDSQEPHPNLKLDWTGDRRVDARDVQHLVEQVFQTRPGDLNLDGLVDFSDFLVLSNNFGSQDATWLEGDLDGNQTVDFADFLLLSDFYG